MLRNELTKETFNPQIAAASNYIGQKLFAYISHGKFINDRIRNKFSKSLIFIGDEGQIYQPLTNTYIGIGQTAYTNAITYIEEAHEKIDALNKMLTASMVTSIYTNWGKDTWQKMSKISEGKAEDLSATEKENYKPGKYIAEEGSNDSFDTFMPTKVYATNDIILRGIGDYDPKTRLAYTHETAHVTDSNIDGEASDNLTKSQKSVLEGSFIKNANKSAFATSGITVSLEKGLNRYMFTYTFKTPDMIPGASTSIWTNKDSKTCKKTPSWSKSITVYFTKDEFASLVSMVYSTDGPTEDSRVESSVKVEDWEVPDYPDILLNHLKDTVRVDNDNTSLTQTIPSTLKAFIDGLVPVYEDGFALCTQLDANNKIAYRYQTDSIWSTKKDFDVKTSPEALISDNWRTFWTERYYLKHQLFKQGKNTISIDDKLTWSYMASAYSYALDFSKDYTDSQVERIYRDLLGETSTALIPVGFDQVAVQIVKENAERNLNNLDVYWDQDSSQWVTKVVNTGSSTDGMDDLSKKLRDYKLNEGSIYVRGINFTIPTSDADKYNTLEVNQGKSGTTAATDTVLPWFMLIKLAKFAERFIKDYKYSYYKNPELIPYSGTVAGYSYSYIIKTEYPSDYVKNTISISGNENIEGGIYMPYFEDDEELSKYTKLLNYALYCSPEYKWIFVKKFDGKDLSVSDSFDFADWYNKLADSALTANQTKLDKLFFMGYERDTDYSSLYVPNEDGTSSSVKFLDADEISNWPNKSYDRPLDSKPFTEPTIGEGVDERNKTAEDINKENDLSKGDPESNEDKRPHNPEDGKWGLPAGNEWGQENTEHGYYGSKYSLGIIYKIIDDLNKDIKTVVNLNTEDPRTGEDFVNKKRIDLYVVNTKWTPMSDVNIADGIQTLKEVAYVLDIITDGWGNQYEDSEGNGILLTYTIANNHDRIVDHEKRLKKIESGENVVKGVGRLDYLTSKYVDVTLTSDVLWKFKYMQNSTNGTEEGIDNITKQTRFTDKELQTNTATDSWNDAATYWDLTNEETFGLPETSDWLGFWANQGSFTEKIEDGVITDPSYLDGTTYNIVIAKIPTSYIVAYNTYMRHYLIDQLYRSTNSAESNMGVANPRPTWGKISNNLYGVGILECKEETQREKHEPGPDSTYIFRTPDSRYLAIHSYVGHVGIGIDLKLAQTYTTTKNLHDGNGLSTGFVCTDINSPVLKKKVYVHAYLPTPIATNPNISYFGASDLSKDDINNYQKRYVFNELGTDLEAFDGTEYTTEVANRFNAFYPNDLPLLKERLIEMGIFANDAEFTDENIAARIVGIKFSKSTNNEDDRAKFRFEYYIDINNAVVDAVQGVYTGKLYSNGLDDTYPLTDNYKFNPTDASNPYYGVIFKAFSDTLPELFLRYSAVKNVTTVDLDYDGLTTTKWVTTYVSNVIDDVSNKLKKIEFESYSFATNLVNSLDSNFEAERGKMVVGIQQRNGIVTPILRDLPKDELIANYKVWGENTENKRNYHPVYSEDIDNEILTGDGKISIDPETDVYLAKDYPLYVKDGIDYTLIENPSDFTYFVATDIVNGKVTDTKYDDLKAKYDMVSPILAKVNVTGVIAPIGTTENAIDDTRILSSCKVGLQYQDYVPLYFQTQHYTRIDGAQLRKNPDNGNFEIEVNGKTYSTKPKANGSSDIYVVIEPKADKESKEYISTKVVQHTAVDGGAGGNSMEITAHITKLADATKTNSGLVDAYDVRETLDNMFEWVDISLWDDDEDQPTVNPINTMALEQGGFRDATFNTETMNKMGSPVYPTNYYTDEEILAKPAELSDDMIKWYNLPQNKDNAPAGAIKEIK